MVGGARVSRGRQTFSIGANHNDCMAGWPGRRGRRSVRLDKGSGLGDHCCWECLRRRERHRY